jgi:hypothetical protein
VRISIEAAGLKEEAIMAEAELADTPCAKAIYEALPMEARANTWGEEIYFRVPVQAALDATAAEVVQAGDLAYWPTGAAFCIFFGPTPASRGGEIRPASAVNVVGRLLAEPGRFKKVPPGATIVLKKAAA